MDKRIKEIKGRRQNASSAPWKHDYSPCVSAVINGVSKGTIVAWGAATFADCQFIAHAPDDIDYLLSEVERLESDKKWLMKEIENVEQLQRDKEMLLRFADIAKAFHDFDPEQINCDFCNALKTCRDAGLLKEW